MTGDSGQPKSKKMNGDWKKVLFQMYGMGALGFIGIGVLWYQVLLPNQRAFTTNATTLTKQIPAQTKVLVEIRDQAKKENSSLEAIINTQSVIVEEFSHRSDEHASEAEQRATEHATLIRQSQEMCDQLKRLNESP